MDNYSDSMDSIDSYFSDYYSSDMANESDFDSEEYNAFEQPPGQYYDWNYQGPTTYTPGYALESTGGYDPTMNYGGDIHRAGFYERDYGMHHGVHHGEYHDVSDPNHK